MSGQKKKRTKKKRMRSYRKLKQFLWAFGMAGLGLGVLMLGWFGIHGRWDLAAWGLVYILVSIILLSLRNIIAALDRKRKTRHRMYS